MAEGWLRAAAREVGAVEHKGKVLEQKGDDVGYGAIPLSRKHSRLPVDLSRVQQKLPELHENGKINSNRENDKYPRQSGKIPVTKGGRKPNLPIASPNIREYKSRIFSRESSIDIEVRVRARIRPK